MKQLTIFFVEIDPKDLRLQNRFDLQYKKTNKQSSILCYFLYQKYKMVIKLKIYEHNISLYVDAYLVLFPICLCSQNDRYS